MVTGWQMIKNIFKSFSFVVESHRGMKNFGVFKVHSKIKVTELSPDYMSLPVIFNIKNKSVSIWVRNLIAFPPYSYFVVTSDRGNFSSLGLN